MLEIEILDIVQRSSQKLISKIYRNIYKEDMSENVNNFITNVQYVGVGVIASTIFSFMFNILSGRLFGPSEYGKFALIQSTAMFLQIPMLLGIPTAMVKYASEKEEIDRQKTIISTSCILVIIGTLLFTVVYNIYSKQISEKLSIPEESFKLAIIFAYLFVFSFVTTNTLRSVKEIKKYSLIKSTYGLLQLVSLVVFIYLTYISYKSIVYSILISNIVVGLLAVPIVTKYISFRFELSWAKIILNFSILTAISDISYIIYTNIDQILINKYMSFENVGIYNAYFYSSINIINVFAMIISIVFLPTISKYEDKSSIFKRLDKLIPYLIIFGIPFMLITEYIVLKIYGEEYPFDFLLALLFGTASVVTVWYLLYATILTSIGIKGAKVNFIGTATIALVNVILDIYLIPVLGLNGAMVATTLGYCCGIGVMYILKR